MKTLITLTALYLLLVACTAAPAAAPTAVLAPSEATPTADEHAGHEPTVTSQPAPTATPEAAATATSAPAATDTPEPETLSGPPAEPLECASGHQPWTRAQSGLVLSMCFDPHPPVLGDLGSYVALVTAEAGGQAIDDAAVAMILIGGMAGMLGEHDEDFEAELEGQGSGIYSLTSAIGPSDLLFNGVTVRVRRGSDMVAFNITPGSLSAP
jgi:hypothetical protein